MKGFGDNEYDVEEFDPLHDIPTRKLTNPYKGLGDSVSWNKNDKRKINKGPILKDMVKINF